MEGGRDPRTKAPNQDKEARVHPGSETPTRRGYNASAASQTTDDGNQLKIVYLNARSIINKIDHLQILTEEYEPDLILITESWCNSNISNAE